MKDQKNSAAAIAKKYGLMLGAFNIVVGLMLFYLDMHYQNNSTVGFINLAIIIVLIMLGIKEFKKFNGGFIKLSEALKTGLGIALISGILSTIYTLIMMNYIDPDFLEKSLAFQKQTMLMENPEMSVSSVDKIIDMQREFSSPLTTSAFILILNLFLGFIVSLVGGLIIRKSQPE